MKSIYIICILSFIVQIGFAQTDIKFNISNYENDTLIIGKYYGDRTLVEDTLFKSVDNFRLKRDTSKLDPGMYLALMKPNNEFIQFLVNDDQQDYVINFTAGDERPPIITGSPDNKLLNDYLIYLNEKSDVRAHLYEQIDSTKENKELENLIRDLDAEVSAKQEKIVAENPNSITADLIKSNFVIQIPEFEGSEDEVQLQKYLYYREHYFDYIDLTKPSNLRTPFFHQKIERYIQKLVPQQPDSIAVAIDKLLTELEPAPETYRFYLSYFLNQYANSDIIGFDAIYVHLINNYYAKGKAPWVDDETREKLLKNAKKLEPILLGKTAPNITLYKEDGSTISVHDIQADYTVMIFWSPTCGHCKKAMPGLKSVYEKYREQGVEILAICTKHREKVKDCWQMIEDKELQWINVVDTYHKSNFRELYNVVTTPRIFILDKDKNIVLKRVPTDRLDPILEQLLKDLKDAEVMDK